MAVVLTAQLSVWSGLWGMMKDLARRGPSQFTGLKVGFLQLVRITKKCVGMGAAFLQRRVLTCEQTAAFETEHLNYEA